MKRPLPLLAIIFCLGIIFASYIKIPFLITYVFTLIFLALSLSALKRSLGFDILLCLLIFLLGAASLRNTQALPACHISKFLYYRNNNYYTLKGLVENEPLIKGNRTSFIFRIREIQLDNLKYNCSGNVLAYLKGARQPCYGEELVLSGNLYRPLNRKGLRRTNYRDYLYNQGIYAVLNVKNSFQVIRLNRNRGSWLKGFAIFLKKKTEKMISRHVSSLPAAILNAMLLGDRKDVPEFINNSMVKSGTVHILVVSGFNVGIVVFIIVLFLKLMRLPRNLLFCVAIPCTVIYCLMTGASTPVVRATLMSIVFMLAFLLKREPDIYNSLALAVIFILFVNPRQLFDISFQLSFASVVSIVYLYPKARSLLHLESLKIKFIKFILEGCLVSFSAWLGTMGFIAYYFKIFSPITVLANIFIVPLAALITLCGFSLILAGLIFPALAAFFASSNELLVMMLLKINTLLIKLPWAYFYLS
jgi:competence protein ComEC